MILKVPIVNAKCYIDNISTFPRLSIKWNSFITGVSNSIQFNLTLSV